METYIRKSIPGYFVEFPEEIDPVYWQGKIGTTYQDFEQDKWIHLSDEQVEFYYEHPYATVEEIINMALTPRTLERAKAEKLEQIDEYNNSDTINGFDVVKDGVTVSDWLTPEKRSNYRNSIDAAKLVGLTSLSLYVGGMAVTLPTQDAELMLAQIQLYADQCFMVTETHKANVGALDTIEAVDGYDNTQGYPQRLTFTL